MCIMYTANNCALKTKYNIFKICAISYITDKTVMTVHL